MPVWPKSFYTFRASLLTARMAHRWRRRESAVREQERAYRGLVQQLASTAFWQKAGIEPNLPYEKFRVQVAPRTHEQLNPAIQRMQRGESDVLWPGMCALYAETAGTSTGKRRLVPATDALLAHLRRAGFDALLHHTARVGHAGIFRGRHLLLGGTTTLRRIGGGPGAAFVADVSGIAVVNLPPWAERHLYEPGSAARVADWEPRLEATAARAITQDISLLAGLPTWTQEFATVIRRQAAAAGRPAADLRSLWPNLECFVHSGLPVAPFQDDLRACLGGPVVFHEVYAAAEAIIAAQDGEPAAGLRLLSDAGVFFEFVPAVDFDEQHPDLAATRAVPVAGVKTGVDYAVLLTTPAGLARYVLGDVVRFVSTSPPRLIPVGRTRLQLNAMGERLNEKHLTDALVAMCGRQRWTLVNFHVAPLVVSSLTGQQRGRHEWWIELKPGTVATPTGPQIAPQLDSELLRVSEEYAARRRNGTLDMPVVRLVMPGVFEHWLRFHGRWGGLQKSPRCRGDRLVADELAQITNFTRD
jgi:hypothetical protein